MTEDTFEKHTHSKKRRHQDVGDEGTLKKHKKSKKKKSVEEQNLLENAPVNDTPTTVDTAVSVEGSQKKHKKNLKRFEETTHEQQPEDVEMVGLTNDDGDDVAESINPEAGKEKKKRKKHKSERKSETNDKEGEDEGEVDLQIQSASSVHNVVNVNEENALAPVEVHLEKKKKKKKDKIKDANTGERRSEEEVEVGLQDEAVESTSSPQKALDGTSIAEPVQSPPEKKKRKRDNDNKTKSANTSERRSEGEVEAGLQDEAVESAASPHKALDDTSITEPLQSPPEKKKRKKDKDKDQRDEGTAVSQSKASKSTSSLRNLETSNSEDILQAFQQLDLARLQGVLGTLDLQSFGLDQPDEDSQATVNTTKATSKPSNRRSIATDGPEFLKKTVKRKHIVDLKNLVDPNAGQPHSVILATKWLSSKELQVLAHTQGLFYKKGKFSHTENHAIKVAVEQYRTSNNMSEDAMVQFIFAKHQQEHRRFWADVTHAVPGRPVQAVYHHVKRMYDPQGNQGRWIPAEDAALRRAVADFGSSWKKIGERVGRTAQDCKDRWRNHLSLPDQQFGNWSQQEIEELTSIVQSLEKGKEPNGEIFWGVVCEKMGRKRSREQCRDKWNSLRLKLDKEGDTSTRRWSNHDTYELLQRMATFPANDDSEIIWKDLNHGQLSSWTVTRLRGAYKKAEKTIPDYENMAYKDVLNLLLERYKKYGEPKAKKKNLKFPQAPEPKSAEIIEDSGDEQPENAGDN